MISKACPTINHYCFYLLFLESKVMIQRKTKKRKKALFKWMMMTISTQKLRDEVFRLSWFQIENSDKKRHLDNSLLFGYYWTILLNNILCATYNGHVSILLIRHWPCFKQHPFFLSQYHLSLFSVLLFFWQILFPIESSCFAIII